MEFRALRDFESADVGSFRRERYVVSGRSRQQARNGGRFVSRRAVCPRRTLASCTRLRATTLRLVVGACGQSNVSVRIRAFVAELAGALAFPEGARRIMFVRTFVPFLANAL